MDKYEELRRVIEAYRIPLPQDDLKKLCRFIEQHPEIFNHPFTHYNSEQTGSPYPLRVRPENKIDILIDFNKPYAYGDYRVLIRAIEYRNARYGVLQIIPLKDSSIEEVVEQEISALNRLKGVIGIPQNYDIIRYESNGVRYVEIFQEFFDRNTLDLLIDEVDLTYDEKLTIAKDVMQGLQAAHAHGIIHQDIKPSNIFIKTNPDQTSRTTVRAALADFGQSTFDVKTPLLPANQEYFPPEVWEYSLGERAESDYVEHHKKMDVWSAGCTLYYLFFEEEVPWALRPVFKRGTKKFRPNEAKEILAIMKSHVVTEPALNKIEHLIGEMLNPDPVKRPSASEVIYKLDLLDKITKIEK